MATARIQYHPDWRIVGVGQMLLSPIRVVVVGLVVVGAVVMVRRVVVGLELEVEAVVGRVVVVAEVAIPPAGADVAAGTHWAYQGLRLSVFGERIPGPAS